MGFFDTRVNALPSFVETICGVLADAADHCAAREHVLSAVAPTALLRKDQKWPPKGVDDTVKVLVDLDFLHESDGELTLAPEASAAVGQGGPSVRMVLRRKLLAADNNIELWGSNQKGRDLTRALAWYLLQDLTEGPVGWSGPEGAEKVQQRQFPERDAKLVQTLAQWNPFARWATYLGLAVTDKWGAKEVLAPDPTDAVYEELGAILGPDRKQVDLDVVIDDLAERCPVLDRGTYRAKVFEGLREGALAPESRGQVSSTLSHALLLLQDRQVLVLEDAGDAPRHLILTTPSGTIRASRLRWLGASKELRP